MGKIHVITRAYIKDNDYILVANIGIYFFQEDMLSMEKRFTEHYHEN